jgi:hypothetical protein
LKACRLSWYVYILSLCTRKKNLTISKLVIFDHMDKIDQLEQAISLDVNTQIVMLSVYLKALTFLFKKKYYTFKKLTSRSHSNSGNKSRKWPIAGSIGLPYPKKIFSPRNKKNIFSSTEFNADHFICLWKLTKITPWWIRCIKRDNIRFK